MNTKNNYKFYRKLVIVQNKLQILEKIANWLKAFYEQGWSEFEKKLCLVSV